MSQDIDKRPISMIQQIGTAGLAQSVERIHGKDEVAGSIPATSIVEERSLEKIQASFFVLSSNQEPIDRALFNNFQKNVDKHKNKWQSYSNKEKGENHHEQSRCFDDAIEYTTSPISVEFDLKNE